MTSEHFAHPAWNPWANDRKMLDLYKRRCRQEEIEMTCAAQAAAVLKKLVEPGESILDAGCAGGHYYWSFLNRGITLDYHGLDYTPEHIAMARTELCPRSGLPIDRFQLGYIEDLDCMFDNVICFNTLTNAPHYALPLERLLRCTKKRILLRESIGENLVVRFTPDEYLDPGKTHIRVYHNTYPMEEVMGYIQSFGFSVTPIKDDRTNDLPELVINIPHYWRILLCERI